MLKLAICGSREISLSPSQLDALVYTFFTDAFHEKAEIVSGGAVGIDTSVREYAKTFGFELKEFLPNYQISIPKNAPLIRNEQIAQYADKLLVIRYPDSNGSKHVISKFKVLNKPVYEIILPKVSDD
jgi:hypothetical protein